MQMSTTRRHKIIACQHYQQRILRKKVPTQAASNLDDLIKLGIYIVQAKTPEKPSLRSLTSKNRSPRKGQSRKSNKNMWKHNLVSFKHAHNEVMLNRTVAKI